MKQWIIKEQSPDEFRNKFPEFLPLVRDMLWRRGLDTQEAIDRFFNPDYGKDLHDPLLMRDMPRAIERITSAISAKEKIIVYGDYDTDGVCGATILISTIKAIGGEDYPVSVYIPDRALEGYGMNKNAIEQFARDGAGLVITVDCGTTNIAETELANEKGIDVIITDHHQVLENVPPAHAFVNPHQKDDEYPFKDLCGTGVAFKVACALIEKCKKDGWLVRRSLGEGGEKWFLDLVALATVADVMPLLGENRTLVRYGLFVLAHQRRIGVKALMRVARVQPTVDIGARKTNLDPYILGFVLAPRLNAAGRIDHANTAFALLNTNDQIEADSLACQIDETNSQRQEIVKNIIAEAVSMEQDFKDAPLIFLGKENWPIGVLGIVAGKLVEKFHKPAFIYQAQQEKLAGSARSVEGFNIVKALTSAQEHLIRFGGHPMAGGFSAEIKNIFVLREALYVYAKKELEQKPYVPTLWLDGEIKENDLNWEFFEQIKLFEPFGEKNRKPIFSLKNVSVSSLRKIGKDSNHVLFQLKDTGGKAWKAIAFGALARRGSSRADEGGDDLPAVGAIIDIAFELDVDEWNGRRELMFKVIDYRIA
ncbi:MAG: single-stranded-DNA-specific exonuclease RecJ [Candidatus Spechtbacteria bacterium]|nr:single-stranded-DNA-specific exonuclease RecJ [Candidatus Spechtbacteria bacterium]